MIFLNPEKVKEIHSKKLEINSHQNIGNDHKGILVDVKRNRIGFGIEMYDNRTDSYYEIFSYDTQKGFQKVAKLSLEGSYGVTSRGLYIGDYFYLCKTSSGICVYDTKKYKKIRSIAY
ncbi:MAG: beta-propeller domain-containing protein [Eubacterium sp.]